MTYPPPPSRFRSRSEAGRAVAMAAAVVCLVACGSGPTTPTAGTGAVEILALRLETPGFAIHAGQASDAVVRDVADRLAAARPRLAADLDVADGDIGTVHVQVWQDEPSWAAALTAFFGQRLLAAGYVTGPTELRLLVTGAVGVNATHEFAHAVSLRLNPSFGNNPRWLWESVALYENGEWVDPRTLAYMREGRPPTLQTLNLALSASQQVYEVGFTLAEFVVSRVGQDGLRQLIRRNGDVDAVLHLSPAQFEAAWYDFVRQRYGL